MNPPELDFGKPTFFERLSNKGFGASAGLGLAHNYLLEVRGRKTDRGVFDPRGRAGVNGKHFLVAPRGRRNCSGAGQIALEERIQRRRFQIWIVSDDEHPGIL